MLSILLLVIQTQHHHYCNYYFNKLRASILFHFKFLYCDSNKLINNIYYLFICGTNIK